MNIKKKFPQLDGICYSPFRSTPWKNSECDEDQMREDFKLLAQHTNSIRTYSLRSGSRYYGERLLKLSKEFNMTIALGLGLGRNAENNDREIAELQRLIKDPDIPIDHIKYIIVGNETRYGNYFTEEKLIEYINTVNDLIVNLALEGIINPSLFTAQITTCDTLRGFTEAIANVVDVVMLNPHPFHAHKNPDNGIDWVVRKMKQYAELYGKEIVVGETGWASDGEQQYASPENALKYLTNCSAHAISFKDIPDTKIYYFQFYNGLWKGSQGTDKPNWGIYDEHKQFKY